MFISAQRRIFDNGIRDSGGIAQTRPSWETTPANYPIKTLPWGAYLDADDLTTIDDDGGTGVVTWHSALTHPTVYAATTTSPVPFKYFLKGLTSAGLPQIGGGTATPSGVGHISFDGVAQYFQSGARPRASERWLKGYYSATAGGGGNEGLWVSDSTTYSITQTVPAFVPIYSIGGAEFSSASSSFLGGSVAFTNILSEAAGTITAVIYATAAVAPSFGTNIAQTPYNNPGILSETNNFFGIYFTTSGVTVGAYDGVARDSGAGPGTNDGWQMVTVACATSTYAVIQVRWGAGSNLLELRVHTASAWGSWTTCDFSQLINGVMGNIVLGKSTNGAPNSFYDGDVFEFSAHPTALSDLYADEEARYIAARIGFNIGQDNAIINDAYTIFGGPGPDGGNSPGFVSFTVARANARTTSAVGSTSKWFWGLSNYFLGLASIDNSGAKWAPFIFDSGGGAEYVVPQTIADDTWGLITAKLSNAVFKTRLNGNNTSDSSAAFTAPNTTTITTNQYMSMGYSTNSSTYLNSAVAFFASAPTLGWSETRIRDVERWINNYYLTAPAVAGTTYDPFGTFGFFGL